MFDLVPNKIFSGREADEKMVGGRQKLFSLISDQNLLLLVIGFQPQPEIEDGIVR